MGYTDNFIVDLEINFTSFPEFVSIVTEQNLCLLTCHMAKPTYWPWMVVKGRPGLICGHQARSTDSSCSRDPNSQAALWEGFLKTTCGVRTAGCMTFFWLAGREVTRWYFRNLNYQPSGSNQHGVYQLWSASNWGRWMVLVPTEISRVCIWLLCTSLGKN